MKSALPYRPASTQAQSMTAIRFRVVQLLMLHNCSYIVAVQLFNFPVKSKKDPFEIGLWTDLLTTFRVLTPSLGAIVGQHGVLGTQIQKLMNTPAPKKSWDMGGTHESEY